MWISTNRAGALALAALLAAQALPLEAGKAPAGRKWTLAALDGIGLAATDQGLMAGTGGVQGPGLVPAAGQARVPLTGLAPGMAAVDLAKLDLGVAEAADPKLGQLFAEAREAYREGFAPTKTWTTEKDIPTHCRPGGALGKPAEGADALLIGENLAAPVYAEEYLKSVDLAILNLEDCVGQVLKLQGQPGDPKLLDNLRGTRALRKELGVAIAEFYNVRKQLWNVLHQYPERWQAKDPWEIFGAEPAGEETIGYHARVDMLTEALEDQLLPARERFDTFIQPLISELHEETQRQAKAKPSRKKRK